MGVKVTAPGYRSYTGEVDLGNEDDRVVVELRKRD